MASSKALVNHLKVILGTDDVSSDIVSYISSIQHEEDYEEFMENILNKHNSAHLESYTAIRNIIFGHPSKAETSASSSTPQEYSKTNGNTTKLIYNNVKQPSFVHKKGKTKFRDINTYQAKKKQKEGRSICDCLGQEHEFMNNCLFCGRIHCIEEGPGPCLFCGNLVTVRGDDSYDANGRKTKLIMKPRENRVFDDDNDYFKIKHKKSENDKQKMVVALDFATRRVIEGTEEDAKIKERLLQDSVEHLRRVEEVYKNIQKQAERSYHHNVIENVNEDLVNLLVQMRHKKPQGVEDLGVEDSNMPVINYNTKVFDEDLMVNMDHGLCLSMHQPWASLLIAGVKKHEGRTWPTNHRGRLWIAAAAKKPENEEIEELETFYREYYQDDTLNFPRNYPTSCLLGCVTVDDCLEEQEYKKIYPNGESNSPYVLICSNPIILPIFYPIVGKHKIYALDKDLHKCAKMALQHATYVM